MVASARAGTHNIEVGLHLGSRVSEVVASARVGTYDIQKLDCILARDCRQSWHISAVCLCESGLFADYARYYKEKQGTTR